MMDRDDLLVAYRDSGGSGRTFHRRVNETDLASLGLVQAPVCGDCRPPCPRDTDGDGNCGQVLCPVCGEHPCPSCGGSGWGRLIPVDGIVPTLRQLVTVVRSVHEEWATTSRAVAEAVQVLAAIDQEDDTP